MGAHRRYNPVHSLAMLSLINLAAGVFIGLDTADRAETVLLAAVCWLSLGFVAGLIIAAEPLYRWPRILYTVFNAAAVIGGIEIVRLGQCVYHHRWW